MILKKIKSQRIKSQKGIALLLATFCTMILMFLAIEITFDSTVEYVLSGKELYRVKAHEAAKAGLELSLLRIQLFKNVTVQYSQQLKGQEAILQMVWSFPFAWPPAVPGDTSIADKGIIADKVGESLMDASYYAQISSEGSKIDINDLDSQSEPLREAVRGQLKIIFEQKTKSDDAFADKYQNFNAEELINNLTDYIDEDSESLNGGDEKSAYSERQDLKTDGNIDFPPNRPFQTLDEIRQVAGMDEELFQFLLPQVTVYGIKAINVNQANKEILKSIDEIITDEVVEEIIKRRTDPAKGGPFRDENDFIGFIGANASTFNPTKIPLFYGNEYNFRVRSVGEYKGVTKEIVAIIYDVDAVRDQLISLLDKEQNAANTANSGNNNNAGNAGNNTNAGDNANSGNNANAGNAGNNNSNQPKKLSNERPRIIYYYEN